MTASDPSTRWISRDFSHLYTDARTNGPLSYDVVIVGSGYGGAMAAAELAGREDGMGNPIRVLVLERGKEYVPGMFPSSGEELPPYVRFHRSQTGQTTGWLDGLFDLRLGPDVCTLVASGVGGGSLINAGVMEIPDWSTTRMPESLKQALTEAEMNKVKERLGARANGVDNTVRSPGNFPPGMQKTRTLEELAPHIAFHPAALTVEMHQNANGNPWNRCLRCGDCMTGCNVGAKKSLDTTLLLEASTRGATIVSGASVTRIKRTKGPQPQWELSVAFTGESLRRRHSPLPIRAGTVILAAGTLGSPEVLLRSQNFNLMFSPRLGQQFSCNGDNILAVQDTGAPTQSVADEYVRLDRRDVGPTITGVLKFDAVESGPGFLVQEFAVPGSLKRIFEEIVTTSALLHRIPTCDQDIHSVDCKGLDPLAVDPDQLQRALVLGIIGHDEGSGVLRLPQAPPMDDSRAVEGRICIDWPDVRKSRLVDDAYDRVGKELGNQRPLLPNPLWRLLPEEMDFVFRSERGPLLTVHPLGGCPIGASREVGAVDEYGRVFDADPQRGPKAFHQGLRVLDGSILPSSLGANPALTIAAVAQRAALQLAGECGWVRLGAPAPAPPRPFARTVDQCTPGQPKDTQVELIEKLCGPVQLQGRRYMAELTVQYEPQTVAELTTRMDRCLQLVAGKSTLRLYTHRTWNVQGIRFMEESARRQHAVVEAPVSGQLFLFRREFSHPWWRILRGGAAYVVNRGLRDVATTGWRELKRRPQWWRRLLALASRAGEVRRFDYQLTVGQPTLGLDKSVAALIADKPVRGEKRFSYRCRGNPWRQLTELKLTRFPGQQVGKRSVLTLDGRFMARQAIPLARIVAQENQVHALAELASFGLYFLRLFASIHLWSLRAPDPLPPRDRKLLPGKLQRMDNLEPEVIEIELEPPRHGIPVLVRLTRYKGKQAGDGADTRPPLVLIHGYSASGTSFAHDAIPEPMARYFWNKGRDVWLLDLRTSAGMPSSILSWNFEDAALADIPVAIARICLVTKQPKVDVFAHCIGAVMLSMALLTDLKDKAQWEQINAAEAPDGLQPTRYRAEIGQLRHSIRRIVLSQKGPVLAYSDGNVLRGYLMRVLRRLILPQDYQFRAPAQQALAGQALDRLLSTLPYPDPELVRENPTWPWLSRPWGRTPWVGFRHRLDALYARAFKLRNLNSKTLDALEDLFGPLNLDSVSQAVHFARYNKITNGAGRNCFVTVSRMRELWPRGGTLSIHGDENGLADVRTLHEMKDLMRAAGRTADFKTLRICGFGHQDCVIGIGAREHVFDPVEEFLS